ncbi:hypothetical protein BJY52DRAFT_1244588 [Lactarius psammicola]|nr:hypothetical protein BJY52DRAFT_1244588 [Lactarius psammicola]
MVENPRKFGDVRHLCCASYNVYEYQLGLILKIPSDWPLQRVTVNDPKRIGVTENRWRG